jgi:hypothetical protein
LKGRGCFLGLNSPLEGERVFFRFEFWERVFFRLEFLDARL